MQAKRDCSNSTPNGQEAQQLNNWPPCERCGSPAPLKTQWGNLCTACYALASEQALQCCCETDDQLCAIVAANSGRDGDKHLLRAASEELQKRAWFAEALSEVSATLDDIKSALAEPDQAPPELPRRSFLSGLFGAVALAALPWRPLEPARPLHPTVAHWQRRLDAAIAPLVQLRDGIGQPITGRQLYALETAVFNALGELVEVMESTPFDDLVNALGLKNDYLRAVGILDQYQAEKAEYEAEAVSRG